MAIPSYIKNVAKSFHYVISDTIKDYNPVIDSLLSDSKSTMDDVFTSIGSFKDDLLSGSEKSLREEVRDSARDIWTNFKDDITSGNWYQRDKREPLADIGMAAMGFDMSSLDIDFDMEDWGDDEWTADDSQKAEVEQSTRNTIATMAAMDEATNRIITGVGKTQVQSTEYLAHVTRNGNKALYDLNKRGFNNISKALLGVNKSITAIAQLGKPLTDHMQNSTIFYTKASEFFEKTTKTLDSIKISLSNIERNNTVSASSRSRKTTFSDIFDPESGMSIDSYINMVKSNFGDTKWLSDALISGVKNIKNATKNGSFGKNISITTMAMQMVTKALIPQAITMSMKGFNEALKSWLPAAMTKFRDKESDNVVIDILKSFILPGNEVNQLRSNQYERGRVFWDGISRKALIETIPGYLRMIYSAISGQDRVYDYDKGQFRSMTSVRKEYNRMKSDIIKEGGGDFRKEAIKKLAEKRGINIEDKSRASEIRAIEAEVDKFFEGAIFGDNAKRSSYHKFNDLDKLAKTMGVSPEVILAMRTILEESNRSIRDGSKKSRRGMGNRMIAEIESARDTWNRRIDDINESGYSVFLNDVNGSSINPNSSRKISNRTGLNRMPSFATVANSLIQVIPGYLTMLLANQQIQLGAMGFKDGVYKYYNYRTGRWTKSISTGMRSIMYMSKGSGTINVPHSREKHTKGSSGGNNRSDDSDDDGDGNIDDYYTYYEDYEEKPRDEVEKEQQEAVKEGFKNSKFYKAYNKVSTKVKDYFKSKHNAPGIVGKAARLIDSLTYNIDTMFFGKGENDPNSFVNVLKKELEDVFEPIKKFYNEHLRQYMTRAMNWLTDHIPGLSSVKDKLKEWKNSSKKSIKNLLFGDTTMAHSDEPYHQTSIEEALYEIEAAKNKKNEEPEYKQLTLDDIGTFAKGGTVKKTGLAVVSKGELIIPSEYNPYYKGPTNKASQIAAENNIEKRYFGKYNKGGIVGRGVELGAEGIGQLISFLTSNLSSDKDKNKDNTNSLANKLKKLTDAAFKGDDKQDNIASMAAGGLIGGGVSLLTGAVVGPLFGAAIGAGTGLIVNSKKVQEVLFGPVVNVKTGEVEGGLLGKKVSNFMVQQFPDMTKGAGIGAAAGLFMGSPVLGAIVGSAVGFAKNSEAVQHFLFGQDTGKKDKDGNPIYDGIIPKKIQDKFKKGLPRAIAGAGIGMLAGPFGFATNIIVGAGLGFLTTSEKFHNIMVGKDGDPESQEKSVLGQFKTKIIDNITDLFMNTGNAIKGFFQKTFTNIGIRIAGFFANLKEKAEKGEGGFLTKLFGGVLGLGGLLLKGTIGLPGLLLSGLATHRRNRNIRKGYNVYDKYAKRNMTAAERNTYRANRNMTRTGNFEFDNYLAGINNKDDLENLRMVLGDKKAKTFTDSKGNTINLGRNMGKRKNLRSLVDTEINAFDPNSGIFRENVQFHNKITEIIHRGFNIVQGIYDELYAKRYENRLNKALDAKNIDPKKLAKLKAEDPEEYERITRERRLNRRIQEHADAAKKDRMTVSTAGGIQQIVTEANGDQHPDMSDSTTKESVKRMDGLFNAITSIPIIGKGFSKLVDTFNNFKNGLYDMLFGEDNESGILGGLFSFFTGKVANFGGISAILSKFAGGAGIIGLTYALLSGKLDRLFSLIPGVGASRETSHSYTASTNDGRIVTKDTNGNWIDESGNIVNSSSVRAGSISASRSDVNAASQRFAISLTSGTARYLSRVTTIDGANTVATLFRRIANGLKNSPILRKFVSEDTIENMFFNQSKGLYTKVATKLGPTGLKTASDIASTALVVLKVAMIVADFSTGYEDARTTLGIFQEPTIPQRLVSGLVRTVKNLVPFIGTLIPDSLVVDVFCNFIGPIFHISPTSLIHQREESAQILEQYNAEHGTNLTTEQFIKDVMHDYTWTERIGNTARGTWESGKLMTSQIFSSIKDKGLLETYNIYKRQVSNTFSAAFNEEEGLLAGTINGIGAVMDETMPGIFGDIKKKKADIWKFAVKGELKDLWKVALDNFSGGGEQIEGTDLTTATTGYSSFMIGQMPLLMTKMIATPFAVASHSFHQMFGDTFEKMGRIIKSDTATLNSNIASMEEKAKDGDIKGIWNIEFNSAGNGISGIWTKPIFKTFNFINKIIYMGKSLLNIISGKLKGIVDDLREKYGWVDDVLDTAEEWRDSAKNSTNGFIHGGVENASSFLSLNGILNALSNSSSNGNDEYDHFTSIINSEDELEGNGSRLAGRASGFVSQLDPKYRNLSIGGMSTADNGCAPAVASMVASSYGRSYSMRNASNDANYYQTSGSGTTMDYFADTLGSRGINVGSINSDAGVYSSLRSGRPVVLLGQDASNGSKSRSPFGPNNHYVMASGLDRRGNIIVNDPEAHGPRSYSPSILRGVKAALGTSGSGSRLRRFRGAGSRLNNRVRNGLRRYHGGATGDTRGTIYAYLKSKGMSDYGVAGLMGCWECESSNRPDRIEGDYMASFPGFDYVMSSNANMDDYVLNILFPAYDKSGVNINKEGYLREDGHYYPGLGLAQWTRGRTYKLLQFCKERGWDWRTLEAQLEYAWYELNSSYSGTLAKLNAARTVDDATKAAFTYYEGCGDNYTGDRFLKRLEYAYNIYNTYSGDTNTFNGFDSSQSATSSSGGFFHNALSTAGNYLANSSIGHTFTNIADRFSTIKDSILGSNQGPLAKIKGLFSGIFGSIFGGTNGLFSSSSNSSYNNYGSYNSSSYSGYNSSSSGYYGTTANNGNDIYNNFPYFNQNDQPWGPVMYSYNNDPSATISTSGCGPTSAAMILKSYGVNTNPIETASYAYDHGYRVNGGTTGGLFPAIGKDAGLDVTNFQSTETAKQYLSNNIPLVALMHKGDFTGGGHYVVVSGYDPISNTFTVNDSNSRPRSETRWDWSKMGQNATNFWSFSKDGVGSIGTYGNRKLQGDSKFNDVTAQKLNGWRNGLSGGASGMYNTRAGSALRKWKRSNKAVAGGASGLTRSSVNTPSSMAHIDAIINKATTQGSSGTLSPAVIYELLAAIIQVLMTIASNTGNNTNIAEMLATYLPKLEAATGLTKEQLKTNLEQARLNAELVRATAEAKTPQNPNLNDVEPSVQKLRGVLRSIATN